MQAYKLKSYKVKCFILCCLFSNWVLADTIKIGIAGPFSGTYVAAGDQQWLGAMQAVEDINARGGINGNKLELVSADDACNVKKAQQIAKRFVASGEIKAVIGHNCSATTVAAAKIYGPANMLMITPASTTPEVTELGYNSIFRTCGNDHYQAEIAAQFISKKLQTKKIAIIYDDSLYSSIIAKNTKLALEKLSHTVALYAEINAKDNNSALIKQISELGIDLVYFSGLHTDAGNFLKYLREHGNKTTFFASDGIASPDFVQAAGGPNIVNGVYMTFFNDPLSNSAAKKVVAKLEKKDIYPTGYTLNSYAAVQAIQAAMQNATQDKLSDWLHQNEVSSVIGSLKWDKNGDLVTAPFIVYKWDNEGEYEPYWKP